MARGDHIDALSYAVRPAVVAKYLGQLCIGLAIVTLVPLLASVLFHEYDLTGRYVVVCIIYVAVGCLLARLKGTEKLQVNEALVIVALVFGISPVAAVWPMSLSTGDTVDALFEAVSAVTTTGLSTLTQVEQLPRTFLLTRAWMQWYGGLGIVVFSVALLMGHSLAARRLIEPDAGENLITTTRTHARRVLKVYLGLTVFAILAFWAASGSAYHGVTHALATVSTGGFSSFNDGVAGFDNRVVLVGVTLFCILGATAFPLLYQGIHGDWRALLADPELRLLLILVAIVTAALVVTMKTSGAGGDWFDALFMAVSAQTTTGFATVNVAELDNGAKALLIVSMLTGGSVGSTAGGFKLLRLLIVLRLLHLIIQRSSMTSHAVATPRLGGRPLDNEEIGRALGLVLLFLLTALASWLVFLFAGYPPLDSLFEVVSALCTVGLSTGITGPELPDYLKLLLCVDMWLGRVEIVALLVVLFPRTWWGKRLESP
jgi:trk system potassium uptake protein TrkH